MLSRRPENTFPSATATPRYVPPSVVWCLHLTAPVAASIAKMFPAPDAMNITPSTTTGVACIVPGVLPSSRCIDHAPPSFDRLDLSIRVRDE